MVQNTEIDISILEGNLELSFEERLIQHQNALEILLEIEKARDQLHEKSQQST